MERLTGLLGLVVLFLVAWLLSTHRRRFPWRLVLASVAMQFALAWILLTVPPAVRALDAVARGVTAVISAAGAGASFVFGDLADLTGPWGFIFAVQAGSVIIMFGALMAVAYHVGLMQRLVAGLAWCLRRSLGITGVDALAVAANVFVGQTEAPLVVRPYLARMTRAQLMLLMTGGFATIAGSVLGVYVLMLGGDDEARQLLFTKHLLVASVMSAPAAVAMARVMVPETETPPDDADVHAAAVGDARNILDAAAAGTTDGLRMAVNVAAMLIAFLALLALANMPLAALSDWTPVAEWRAARGYGPFTVEGGLGILFTPLAAIMGVPWAEAPFLGSLLGQKLFLTELIAYGSLGERLAAAPDAAGTPAVDPRTAAIAAYALCGFANLPSVGIQIGGIAALVPERRGDLAELGLRAMLAGAFASWCTACVAGVFIAG
jgi:CNT family concentrative nucleoside transporter